MERLTMRVDNGLEEIYFYNPDDPEGEYTLSDIAKNGHDDICDQIANRLAAYEDTGLTPEQIENQKQIVDSYAQSARVIALYLKDFCNEKLSYAEMIADAARKASGRIKALTADKDEQAGQLMKMDYLLRRTLPILEVANDQQGLIDAINALLGGKENGK